jgi:hypothetical protein
LRFSSTEAGLIVRGFEPKIRIFRLYEALTLFDWTPERLGNERSACMLRPESSEVIMKKIHLSLPAVLFVRGGRPDQSV